MTKLAIGRRGHEPVARQHPRGFLKSGELNRMVDDGVLGATWNPRSSRRRSPTAPTTTTPSRRSRAHPRRPRTCTLSRDRGRARGGRPDPPSTTTPATSTASCRSSCRPTWQTTRRPPSRRRRVLRPHGRPNVHENPGNRRGRPHDQETITAGIDVNVTLFSLAQYEAIHMAYLRGLDRRLAAHQPIADVHSVAKPSSRASTPRSTLSCPRARSFEGRRRSRTRLAYRRLGEISRRTGGRSWPRRARRRSGRCGHRRDEELEYSDILYVDELIGPDCVNTMPEGTMRRSRIAGRSPAPSTTTSRAPVPRLPRCRRRGLARQGHPQAEVDGVKSFSDSFDSLIGTIRQSLDAQRAA